MRFLATREVRTQLAKSGPTKVLLDSSVLAYAILASVPH
jgi:hypothetical protein